MTSAGRSSRTFSLLRLASGYLLSYDTFCARSLGQAAMTLTLTLDQGLSCVLPLRWEA